MVISNDEFFGRTLKYTSIRAEVDDLDLTDLGVQKITYRRMKSQGMLESLCDSLIEKLGRRHRRDMGRFLGETGDLSCS